MSNDFIDMIEPTPELKSKKCKLISVCIWIFLQFSIYITGLTSWYLYDYFIAISTIVLWFILIGIIRSKLRNSSIPFGQREYFYNDKDIAKWYTAKNLCYVN